MMHALSNPRPIFNRVRQRNNDENKAKNKSTTIRDVWLTAILLIIAVMCFVLASKHSFSIFVGLVFVFLVFLVWAVNLIKGHMAKNKDSIWHKLNCGCLDISPLNDDVETPAQPNSNSEADAPTTITYSYTLSSTELKSILRTMLQELRVLQGEYNLVHTDDLSLANDIIKDYSLMDYETDRLNGWLESEAVPSGEELNDVRHSLGVLQHNLSVLASTVLNQNNSNVKTPLNTYEVSTDQTNRPRALSAHQLLLYSTKMHVPPSYEETTEQKKRTIKLIRPKCKNNNLDLDVPSHSININNETTTPDLNSDQILNSDSSISSCISIDNVQTMRNNSCVSHFSQYSDSLYVLVAPADETGAPPAYGDIHDIV